jgi:hypothetical protein
VARKVFMTEYLIRVAEFARGSGPELQAALSRAP